MTIQLTYQAIKGNTLMQGVPLLDTLVQSIEKSRVQSHLSGNVLETLSASTLVLRLSSLDDVQNSHGATLKQVHFVYREPPGITQYWKLFNQSALDSLVM